jgi:uncharacterized protein (TIGR04255 family)
MKQSAEASLEFERSPLIEVALDVQFESLPKLRGPHLGLLWGQVRDRFPVVQEQAILAPLTIEAFGVPVPQESHLELNLLDPPPVSRLWFEDESGSELIQVQQDRFIVNWRRVNDHAEYPHYRYVREFFEAECQRFQSFVAAELHGDVIPNQCAVTYFNHIIAGKTWQHHGEVDKVFTVWKAPNDSAGLPELNDVKLTARYVITGDTGDPLGRLHVEVQPAFRRSDDVPIYVMSLTARGRPDGEGLDGVLRFFDNGHLWASKAFIALTTPEMHEEWGAKP